MNRSPSPLISTAIPTFRHIYQPVRDEAGRPRAIGTIQFDTFTAYLFAYLLCEDGFAALLFGAGSKTQLDAIWAACLSPHKKVELSLDVPDRRVFSIQRLPDTEGYERFDPDDPLPLSNGRPLLLLSRTALTDYLAHPPEIAKPKTEAQPERSRRFITFGPPGGTEPYALWLTQLRQLLLLPEQPGWADVLWREAVKWEGAPEAMPLITPLPESVGFAPAWRVAADRQAWQALYSHLARQKKLPVTDTQPLAATRPVRVAWSLKGYRAWSRP